MDTEEVISTTSDSPGTSTTWLLIYTALALFVINYLFVLTSYWRIGVSGPLPLPLLGNFASFFSDGFVAVLQKWQAKYGDIFGCYIFKGVTFVTSDVDLARLVLIKECYTHFYSRKETDFEMKYFSDSLVMQNGAAWKRSRSYVSPAFSGSMMKRMIPGINSCCDKLMNVLDKKYKDGATIDPQKVFNAYVLDGVACCAFGIDSNCQENPDDPFTKNANQMNISMKNPVMILMMLAPFLAPVVNYLEIDLLPRKATDFFADVVKCSMELRKKGDSNERKDFLQLMINAAESDENEEQGEPTKDGEQSHQDTDVATQKKKIPLTADEIMGQCMIFFIAGQMTVVDTMSFVLYALATNPEVQTKLQEEIDEMVPEGKPVSYDMVFKMEYLDKVWCEVLRLYPVGFVLARRCTQDFVYKGRTICNDQLIYVNVFAIHHDPAHWPQPDKFDPERFTKEAKETRHPCAYLPFGAGPRNCVGMRFAILQSKIALICMLQKYSFETTPETPDLGDTRNFGSSTLFPDKSIQLRLVQRN